MKRTLLILTLLLTGSCTGHRPPLVVVVPPVVVPVWTPHTWTLPVTADNGDRFCLQTNSPIYRPCWTVGYLRAAMVSVKAE